MSSSELMEEPAVPVQLVDDDENSSERLPGQSGEQSPAHDDNDDDRDNPFGKRELWLVQKYRTSRVPYDFMWRATTGNILPVSNKELPKASPKKALNFIAFLTSAWSMVINFPSAFHGALLVGCVGFLVYQATSVSTTPFDIPHGNSLHSPLSFVKAFPMYLPEMVHISKFILCWILTCILAWPVQTPVLFVVVPVLISAPMHYFPELIRKAAGVDVDCGAFNLSLILFATLGALGLSLIFGSITLLMLYCSWRRGKVKEVTVSWSDLAKAMRDCLMNMAGSLYS